MHYFIYVSGHSMYSHNGYKVVILWKQFRMKMCTLHNKSLVCWLTFLSSLPILHIWSLIPKIKFISWIFCSGINLGIFFENKYGLVSWYYWKTKIIPDYWWCQVLASSCFGSILNLYVNIRLVKYHVHVVIANIKSLYYFSDNLNNVKVKMNNLDQGFYYFLGISTS